MFFLLISHFIADNSPETFVRIELFMQSCNKQYYDINVKCSYGRDKASTLRCVRLRDGERKNLYYVDKTMYLNLLEQQPDNLFYIRPRRFGKSLFISMMRAYYDKAMADRFDSLFGGFWIHEHPTPADSTATGTCP